MHREDGVDFDIHKSLEFYFRAMLQSARRVAIRKISELEITKSAFNSSTMLSDFFDEIILDEAQDMTENQLGFLHKSSSSVFWGGLQTTVVPWQGQRGTSMWDSSGRAIWTEQKLSKHQTNLRRSGHFSNSRNPPEAIERSRDGATVKYRHTDLGRSKNCMQRSERIHWKTEGNIGILVPSSPKLKRSMKRSRR